jgi:inhibitor of cysteine peptidase
MLQFNESSNGSEIELNIGEKFEIILPENPSTGFRWNLVSNGEPACKLLDNSFVPSSGSPGSSGNHSWQFQAVQEGLGKIELVYRRSWEQNKRPAQSFTLSLRFHQRSEQVK